MTNATTLYYVADPMCSWCWGFAPVLQELTRRIPDVPVQIVLGGLAADSDEPMAEEMRHYVQQAWRDVRAASGAQFNFDFWAQCQPRRSTYPACRAVVLARQQNLESQMFSAIQKAYYLQAKNPSDASTLADLAVELGMGREQFLFDLNASATQQLLEKDFHQRHLLGANSFPSIGIRHCGKDQLIHRGWGDVENIWQEYQAATE
jgi:putative protein-disulfide isomerase